MDSHWSKFKIGAALGTLTRVAAATGMLVLTFGPMPFQSTPTVSANAPKTLEWGDARPPLTTIADSADIDGFTHLPGYDNALHAITVASNGDLFTAGTGLDVNGNQSVTTTPGDVDCADPLIDYDGDADAVCDVTLASTKAHIYKSVDGGKSWRAARMLGVTDGTTVQQIVVSPDYPSDPWIGVVFSTLVAGDVATALNGLCWSTDGGLTFAAAACFTGAGFGTDADLGNTLWRTGALSPDFNWNDSNGQFAMGGTWVAGAECSVTASTTALKAALAAGTFVAIPETTAAACNAATDSVISLAYTNNEEPIALARLLVFNGAQTFGQIRAAGWPATAAGDANEINDDDTTDMVATMGRIAFDDEYTTGGSYYAAVGGAAPFGGVFFFNGTGWSEKTLGDAGCDVPVSDLAVSGNSSTAKLVASLALSNVVCRSSNAGSSWSDTDADGGDSVCDNCRVVAAAALTRIAARRSDAATVYWTSSGNLGGVFKSTASGSSWSDTGLTNQAYLVTGVDEISDSAVLVSVTTGGDLLDALFISTDYGTGATYKRVIRYDAADLSLVGLPGDFATLGIGFVTRTAATTDVVIKTTDGGNVWDTAGADPFEASPETNELASGTHSQRTGTNLYIGGSKGHVAVTTDGGSTYTLLAKDFGDKIDEFDFSDATTFFITALDTDTTYKVWQTRDGGATFTQAGNTPWGTGDGSPTTSITGYKASDNSGFLHMSTRGATTTDDVWRLKMGDANWSEFEPTDVAFQSMLQTTTGVAGVGDGQMMTLWDSAGAGQLFISFYPNTGDLNEFDATNAGDDERDNLLQLIASPPVAGGSMGTTRSSAGGYHLQTSRGGRIMEMTLTTAFLGGAKLVSPISNSSVPTNIGDNGVPLILRWDSIPEVDTYDVMMGLNPTLTDGVIIASPATNLLTVTAAINAIVQGNIYYWKVRATTANAVAFEGPWSATNSFSVASQGAPQSPQPSLPQNGAQLPGLSTQLSWNNPAGVTQVQVQVTPLNGDGPQINLIIGSAINSYDVPAPLFGTGPYVILPGAGYTWRVRTTGSTNPTIGENDSAWGPWSEPRTFTTAAANSGTIQLLAPINGAASSDTTPTVQWKDANSAMFYYEVQLSRDPNFGESGIVAPVYWNLIHGGQSTPANSWTVPDSFALTPGTYYWRVRQRTQATPRGSAETGIAWSPSQSFVVS